MTLTPPEQPRPEEIIVPKNIIRPFVRGLSQLSSEPLQKIKGMLSAEFGGTDLEREQIDEMRQALDGITTTLALLKTAKEVKVIHPTKDRYHLAFSSETEEEEIPQKGKVPVDESLAIPLVNAVFDLLGHHHSIMNGHAILLQMRATSEEIKERMNNICSKTGELATIWGPIQASSYEIEISTDAQGKTTITPIPRPTPQP